MFQKRKLTLAIPEPCQENWSEMPGTARERFCEKCQHAVIDFSVVTRKEALRITQATAGRVCGHLIVDQSGSPVFRPEPPSRSFARIAGLSLAGIAGVAAQSTCELQVKVKDITGAAFGNASVSLKPGQSGVTDPTGAFTASVPAGTYQVEVRTPGFAAFRKNIVEVSCSSNEPQVLDVELKLDSITGVMVVIAEPDLLHPLPSNHRLPDTKKRQKR